MVTMSEITDVQRMLAGLQVADDALPREHADALDRDGFLVIPDFISPGDLQRLRSAYEQVITSEGVDAGKDHHQEAGARRIGNLINKGAVWYPLWTHPLVLAAAYHVLQRDFRLGSMSGRDPLQGGGHQGYHSDCGARLHEDQPYAGFAVCVLLDDFTPTNGSTRLVAGSHRRLGAPTADEQLHIPGELTLTAQAGSAFFFNAHLWHAGNVNVDGSVRRLVHLFYQGREHAAWLDQRKHFRNEACAHVSAPARRLLDVAIQGDA